MIWGFFDFEFWKKYLLTLNMFHNIGVKENPVDFICAS